MPACPASQAKLIPFPSPSSNTSDAKGTGAAGQASVPGGEPSNPNPLPRVGFQPPHPARPQRIFSDISPVSTRGHRHDTDGAAPASPSSARPAPSHQPKGPGMGSRPGVSSCRRKADDVHLPEELPAKAGRGEISGLEPWLTKTFAIAERNPFCSQRRSSGIALLKPRGCGEGDGPSPVGAEGHPPSPISSNLCVPVHSPGREHEPSGAAPLGKWLHPEGAVGLLANPDAGKDPVGKR